MTKLYYSVVYTLTEVFSKGTWSLIAPPTTEQ